MCIRDRLSTEARRVPVQGTPIPLISVFTAISHLDTVCNYLFSTRIAELLELTVSISLDDSTTTGGHDTFVSGDSCFCVAKVAPVALSTITASVK